MLVYEEIGRTEELKRRKEVSNFNKTLQHTIITSNPNNLPVTLPILSPNTPSTPTTPTKPQISIVFLWFVIFPSFPPFWDFRFFFVVVFIFLSLSFFLPSFYPFLGPYFCFLPLFFVLYFRFLFHSLFLPFNLHEFSFCSFLSQSLFSSLLPAFFPFSFLFC